MRPPPPQDLSLSWWHSPAEPRPPPGLLPGLSALASLTCLRLGLRGRGGFYDTLSLAPLAGLRSLALSGCHSLPLALSLTELTGLTALELSGCGEAVSANVLVQVRAAIRRDLARSGAVGLPRSRGPVRRNAGPAAQARPSGGPPPWPPRAPGPLVARAAPTAPAA